MPTEPDDITEAFRSTYRQLVESAPPTNRSWPPMLSIQGDVATSPRRSGWIVAIGTFLVTVSFWIGWAVAPGEPTAGADTFQIQTEDTADAIPDMSGTRYATPVEAAMASAADGAPEVDDAQVTRIVGIYADDATVDLRVQIQAEDFCHWYGVVGRVVEGALEWSSGPALPCSD